jgi:acyl carrier protein
VDVSYYECDVTGKEKVIPIGRPIDNIRLYVLDGNKQLVPYGVRGELYISGAGVGRGYVNNPTLTLERFTPNPYAAGERLYKTGDVVRWLPDGNLEYLGRSDHQVKIRGYRIELGEIESQLLGYTGIKAVVVAVHERGDEKQLAAYYESAEAITAATLRNYLLGRLPGYMIPSWFVHLPQLPLNVNGKVDRKALPEPVTDKKNESQVPETEWEQQVFNLWQQVLLTADIGTKDDFFEVGGNSLRLISLFTLLEEQYPNTVKVRNLFEYRTITGLAGFIQAQHNSQEGPVRKKKTKVEF